MRRLTNDDVAGAPLPPGLIEAWNSYLALWQQGLRTDAHAAAQRFVDRLLISGSETRTAFARWLCALLFDESDFWAGQWGGGLTPAEGSWHRPVAPALTAHPISARITLPYLLSSISSPDSRHLRWMYQFTVGQSYRLPPRERQRWQQALEALCGPGEAPIELLRRAQDDALARRMLRDADGI
jgi:hypothetical protein